MIYFSSIEPVYYLLPLIGLVIGLFGTLLGGGGGFFFLPVLTLLIGVEPQTAVTTSLAASLPIGLAGSLGHYRRKNINFRIAGVFMLAGVCGALLGTLLTHRMSGSLLKTTFGVYSFLLALNIIVTTRCHPAGAQEERSSGTPSDTRAKGSFYGFFAGMISGTFGTSGTAPVLAGLLSLRLPLKTVIGTSLLVVLSNTLVATGTHLLTGRTDLTLVAFLTAGSAAGALLGPRILAGADTDRSENRIRYLYAAVVAAIGILMIINR